MSRHLREAHAIALVAVMSAVSVQAEPAQNWKLHLDGPVRWFKTSPPGVFLVGTDREIELLRTTQTMGGWSLAGSGTLSAIVTRRDGRKFVLKWLSPQAIGFVQSQVFREMAPRVRDELNRGQPVRFGDVEMSPDALVHKRERIPWEEIEKVEFSYRVVVHKRDGTRAIFFNVTNLELFLALAQARSTTGRFDLPETS